jgi:hypothetical protein
MEFLGRRVRVRARPDSAEITREHADEYGEIVRQVGTIQEGIREYDVRLDGGDLLSLGPGEVEILD